MTLARSPKQQTHFSMLRSYQMADLLTLSNAAAGTGAIMAMISYLVTQESWRLYLALLLLPVALAFDIADGWIARWRDGGCPFGQELDSLADIVSFGVAPAVLAYVLGMRAGLDMVFLIYFVVCGISRLARYNITAAELADQSGKVRYFEGTPIPSSLLLVAILGFCFHTDRIGDSLPLGVVEVGGFRWHPFSFLFFINGSTMISKTLRIPKL